MRKKEKYVIENNMPIPTRHHVDLESEEYKKVEALKVMQSLLATTKEDFKLLMQAVGAIKYRLKRQFIFRTVSKRPLKWRIWRVKDGTIIRTRKPKK